MRPFRATMRRIPTLPPTLTQSALAVERMMWRWSHGTKWRKTMHADGRSRCRGEEGDVGDRRTAWRMERGRHHRRVEGRGGKEDMRWRLRQEVEQAGTELRAAEATRAGKRSCPCRRGQGRGENRGHKPFKTCRSRGHRKQEAQAGDLCRSQGHSKQAAPAGDLCASGTTGAEKRSCPCRRGQGRGESRERR